MSAPGVHCEGISKSRPVAGDASTWTESGLFRSSELYISMNPVSWKATEIHAASTPSFPLAQQGADVLGQGGLFETSTMGGAGKGQLEISIRPIRSARDPLRSLAKRTEPPMRRIGTIALITLAVLMAAMVLVVPSGLIGSLMDGAMILRAGGRFPPDASRVYKPTPTRPLEMHIFKPRPGDSDAKGVTAVLFHGGGFHSGWPEEYFPLARALADAGHTAFVPQYRLQRADGATWTDEFEDVLDAIEWTRAHAAEFGADPERLVLGGSSAGAHLAAAAVTVPAPDGRHPPAAIGLLLSAAYVDSGDASQRSRERAANASFMARALLGEPQDVFGGRSLAYSPRAHLHAAMPPTLMMLGEDDRLWPAASAFCDAMNELGGRCRAKAYPNAGHAFAIFGYENYELMVQDSLAALAAWTEDPPAAP